MKGSSPNSRRNLSLGPEKWRGNVPIPEHAHPLVRRLIVEANAQHTTMKEIADRAAIQPGTFSDWRYRRMPRLDLLEAALNTLDLELYVRRRK